MPRYILVTGASGFVGQALCAELTSCAYAVRGVFRSHTSAISLGADIGQIIIKSMDGETSWSAALRNVDVVVHLAARVHVMNDVAFDPLTDFRRVNVEATLRLARQAAIAGVKRFVFISSVKVNGEATGAMEVFRPDDVPQPQDAYSISKMEAEKGLHQIAVETGMEVVVIRPPLIYGLNAKGNFAALIRIVKYGVPLPLASVHNHRSLVGLDNLVNFIVTCVKHPLAANQTFLVSDGQDLSTPSLIRKISEAANISTCLFPLPVSALHIGAWLLGKENVVKRLCGNLRVDISKSKQLLGWVPPVSVDEGIRRAIKE